MSAPFRYYLRVRYAECDAQKVVFNSRYAEYVDVAMNEFLRAVGYDTNRLLKSSLDFQLVKQTIEWKRPARFDDTLAIEVEAVQLGTTSFTCRATVRTAGSDAIVVTIDTVYVLVGAETMTKTPLPVRFRTALQKGARGTVVDHAAYVKKGSGVVLHNS